MQGLRSKRKVKWWMEGEIVKVIQDGNAIVVKLKDTSVVGLEEGTVVKMEATKII